MRKSCSIRTALSRCEVFPLLDRRERRLLIIPCRFCHSLYFFLAFFLFFFLCLSFFSLSKNQRCWRVRMLCLLVVSSTIACRYALSGRHRLFCILFTPCSVNMCRIGLCDHRACNSPGRKNGTDSGCVLDVGG